MTPENYQLFATDMDGTFLNDQMDYDRTKFAQLYQKMSQKNIPFVVASGNQYYQLRSFFAEYPDIIYIAENGAYICNQHEEYRTASFSQNSFAKILKALSRYPEIPQNLVISGVKSAYILASADPEFAKYAPKYYHHLQQVPTFAAVDDTILKFSFNYFGGEVEEFQKEVTKKLHGIADLTTSGNGNFDLIQPGLHKANGLQVLAKTLNIPLTHMCAFGDGGNDLEMLTAVGDGVAVANASDSIKQIADHTTGSNNEQGVLSYIDALI
ncbi:haloacid dehalogenase [Ligilactobacillus salitolerans]|uniref:Haloacid dehalogenase n=1 Tax=Ligilactobacillus salitolerans TaxID=1808352 RepID=A0A401IV02_9LACO|nr:Cof-type HAD-IIB family hydrolase [Ligilactobacillus salitolerans]GBG95328.1 haloacid dehalogenase [Ligilactobacillus salitolerans]